jgi:hypothetical protein
MLVALCESRIAKRGQRILLPVAPSAAIREARAFCAMACGLRERFELPATDLEFADGERPVDFYRALRDFIWIPEVIGFVGADDAFPRRDHHHLGAGRAIISRPKRRTTPRECAGQCESRAH